MHAAALGDAVAGSDGVELDRRTAPLSDTFLDPVGQLPQVVMPWVDLAPGIGYADQRSREVSVTKPHRPI